MTPQQEISAKIREINQRLSYKGLDQTDAALLKTERSELQRKLSKIQVNH